MANYRRVALEEFLTTHEASVPTFLALVSDIHTYIHCTLTSIYPYMYIIIDTCMYSPFNTSINICVHKNLRHSYIHKYAFMHIYIHTFIHTKRAILQCVNCFSINIYVMHIFYIHSHVHTYVHTYIHTCIHTHIHTYICT